MYLKNSILIICTAFLMMACSSTAELKPVEFIAPIVESQQKGFSLLFPERKSWSVTNNEPYKIVLTRNNAEKNERYTIQALMVKLPAFEEDQAFLNYIKKRMDKNRESTNLKLIEHQAALVDGQAEKCVQYYSREESLEKSDMLGMVNFTCRHPSKRYAGVYLAFSKKSGLNESNENLLAQATTIFSHLTFSEF